MFWLVFLVGAAILLMRGQINDNWPWMEPLALLSLAGCIVILILLVAVSVYRDSAVGRVHTLLGRLSHRLADRVTGFLDTFVHGLQALHARSAYAEIMIASLLLNAGYLLMIYTAFLAFGFADSPFSLGIPASFVVLGNLLARDGPAHSRGNRILPLFLRRSPEPAVCGSASLGPGLCHRAACHFHGDIPGLRRPGLLHPAPPGQASPLVAAGCSFALPGLYYATPGD